MATPVVGTPVDGQESRHDSTAGEVLAGLQQQRSAVVNAFLWVMLGLAIGTFAINIMLMGSEILTVAALTPNVLLLATVLLSMWLNRRGKLVAATLLTTGLILFTASLVVLVVGIEGNAIVLGFDYAVLKDKFEARPETREWVAETLSQLLGTKCTVRCVVTAQYTPLPDPQPAPETADSAPPNPQPDPETPPETPAKSGVDKAEFYALAEELGGEVKES